MIMKNNVKAEISPDDLLKIRDLIFGSKIGDITFNGFVNERTVTEDTKRDVYKIGCIINASIDEFEKKLHLLNKDNPTKEEVDIIKQKATAMLSDKVTVFFNPIDFNSVKNLSFASNYQLLYDKVFINA